MKKSAVARPDCGCDDSDVPLVGTPPVFCSCAVPRPLKVVVAGLGDWSGKMPMRSCR